MKKIIPIFLFIISILSISACDSPKEITPTIDNITNSSAKDDRFSAPFGLRWGSDLDEIKRKLIGKYEIVKDQKSCPAIIIKTESIEGGVDNAGEYELTILPKYKNLEFSGLMGVRYKSEPANKTAYNYILDELIGNLKRKYGEPKEVETKDIREIHYFFEVRNELQVSLSAGQIEDYFHISLQYVFFPVEHQESIKQNIDTIKEECARQRNPL